MPSAAGGVLLESLLARQTTPAAGDPDPHRNLLARPSAPASLVLDDEVCDWKGEAIEGGFRASFFKPAGVLVWKCHDDEFIRGEGAKRVLDRFHRVGIADAGLDVVGRRRLGKLVGPLGCVSAGVVLGVCQPVEPGDARGWRDDQQLCILACVPRTDVRRAAAGTEAVATTSSRRGTASAYPVRRAMRTLRHLT